MCGQIKYYRNQHFLDWITNLSKDGFLKPINYNTTTTYSLNAPLQIRLQKKAIERLKRRYKPDCEIGGILLAEPMIICNERMLSIAHIRFIENLSKNDQTRPLKYSASGDHRVHMDRCLCGRKDNTHYIPIWFHSHPRQQTSNLSEFMVTFFNMSTSDADKKSATRCITYEVKAETAYEVSFKFPSALVIFSKEGYFFIGLYGGSIAPDDFKEYMRRLLNKTTKDMINWAGSSDNFWEGLLGIIGAIGTGLLSVETNNPIFRALAAQTALTIKDQNTDRNYFSLSKDIEDIRIAIP
jgi:hypothetical protein